MYMASIHLQLKRKCLTQNCGKKVELINSKEGRVLSGGAQAGAQPAQPGGPGKKKTKNRHMFWRPLSGLPFSAIVLTPSLVLSKKNNS